MGKAGTYDNLAEVLEVVDISSGDVTSMTADELKLRIKEQIDASVDKFYSDALEQQKLRKVGEQPTGQDDPRPKFNLSQFYADEQKQSMQAIQAKNQGVHGSDVELSATAVSSGGETP